jgi:hypothetical protein
MCSTTAVWGLYGTPIGRTLRTKALSSAVRTEVAMSGSDDRYWYELDHQIMINEAQRDELRDLLSAERMKAYIFIVLALISVSALAVIAFLFFSNRQLGFLERYATFVNISIIFSLFAILEFVALINAALTLIRRIRRLIKQHELALAAARHEMT